MGTGGRPPRECRSSPCFALLELTVPVSFSPQVFMFYASQILQPLAPRQPSVVRDPQNVPIVLAQRYRNPMRQARMDIGG